MNATALPLALPFALAAGLLLAAPAAGQPSASVPACETQAELEQLLGSDGAFTPDGCREITVTRIEIDGADPVCVIDLSPQTDPGILDRLTEAAVSMQWWVPCAALAVP